MSEQDSIETEHLCSICGKPCDLVENRIGCFGCSECQAEIEGEITPIQSALLDHFKFLRPTKEVADAFNAGYHAGQQSVWHPIRTEADLPEDAKRKWISGEILSLPSAREPIRAVEAGHFVNGNWYDLGMRRLSTDIKVVAWMEYFAPTPYQQEAE